MSWVIDSSSIIAIKERTPREDRKRIVTELAAMVEDGKLWYPTEVAKEIAYYKGKETPDLPQVFCQGTKEKATKHGLIVPKLEIVMAHPQASKVIDPDKTGDPEDADPYVLALALHLKDGDSETTVVTEETRSRENKLAMSEACGLLKLYSVSLLPFLASVGIYPSNKKPDPSYRALEKK